jgi:lysozyme
MARVTNDLGLALIKRFEGLKLDAYQDVAGIWTIGYGHTRGVTPGMHISEDEAEQALKDDLHGAENAVDTAVGAAATNDNQFSAMASLCFNIGSANFRSSTVLKQHLAGNATAAADAFLLWNKARINGVLEPVTGLTNRRSAERTLYLTPV